MVDKGLLTYIQQNLKAGYSKDQIRQTLLRSGYNSQIVEQALSQASKTPLPLIPIIIAVSIILIGLTLFFLLSGEKAPPFQLITSTTQPSVIAGNTITINLRLLNYQDIESISFTHDLIDSSGNSIISYPQSASVNPTLSYIFVIPETTEKGSYTIKTVATVDDETFSSSFGINIIPSQPDVTQPDVTQPDVTQPDVTQPDITLPSDSCPSCDDFNPCTKDECSEETNFQCIHTSIIPCCGNYVCDRGEDYFNCGADCYPTAPSDLEFKDDIDIAKEKAQQSPDAAKSHCDGLSLEDDRDTCYFTISDIAGSIGYCDPIVSDSIRDNCYTKVGLLRGDTSVCPKITNKYMRESCTAMTVQ